MPSPDAITLDCQLWNSAPDDAAIPAHSAGIAETVSADLAALGRFRVIDRWRVVEAARRPGGTLQEVAASLRVRLLVVLTVVLVLCAGVATFLALWSGGPSPTRTGVLTVMPLARRR